MLLEKDGNVLILDYVLSQTIFGFTQILDCEATLQYIGDVIHLPSVL